MTVTVTIIPVSNRRGITSGEKESVGRTTTENKFFIRDTHNHSEQKTQTFPPTEAQGRWEE